MSLVKEYQDREKWFERILDAMSELVLVKGERSQLLWANRAFRRLYGLSNEELNNLIDAEHSDPDDTIQYVRDDHYVYSTGQTLDIPSEAISDPKGRVEYFHTIKTAVTDDDNKVKYTVGVSRPVTSQGLIDLGASNRDGHKTGLVHLRSFVSQIPVAVVMVDVRHRILCCSKAWNALFNQPSIVLNQDFFADVYGEILPIKHELEQAIHQDNSENIPELEVRVFERKYWFDVTVQPWHLGNEDVGGAIVMLYDITSRRKAERLLAQQQEQLEALVDERTRSLTQAQGRLMQRERLSTLGRLTATVSHELRNPLGAIRNSLFAIRMGVESQVQSSIVKACSRAERSIVRCDRIIDELLTYATNQRLCLQLTDMSTWFSEVLEDVEVPEDIQINVDFEQSLEMRVDPDLLRRALLNIIINGVQSMQDEHALGTKLEISTSFTKRGFEILVKDEGSGISAEQMEHIFEPLYSSKSFGVGLGLCVVKEVMIQHGGGVEFESQVGQGTAVRLWIDEGL